MTITTTTGAGLRAVNGGTVNVTGTSNDVTSTSGTPVTISDTNVGANGVRFRAVTSSGAANGIFLNNTGNTGGQFRVDGTGAVGSGGTLAVETGVSTLVLFHHSPERTDDELDRRVTACQALADSRGAAVRVIAAAEGLTLDV
jgi:hypothetical protein